MAATTRQLTLAVRLRDDETFASFESATSMEIVQRLAHLARGDAGGSVWLWGAQGCGKSHLLQASCHEAHHRDRRVAYLPLREIALEADAFADLSRCHLVCIDDFECLADAPLLERAFVPLFDEIHARGGALVMAARVPPAEIAFTLPDVRSRAAAAAVYRLPALDDAGRVRALRARASIRGLTLSDEVARFILARASRDMAALMSTLDALDAAALREKRRLTIPFVKEVLSF